MATIIIRSLDEAVVAAPARAMRARLKLDPKAAAEYLREDRDR